MEAEEWRQRIVDAIMAELATGRARRDISKAAGLGENYVSQMLTRGTSPRLDEASRLIRELGLSLSYVFLGIEMTPDVEELLQLFLDMPEDVREAQTDALRKVLQHGANRKALTFSGHLEALDK